MAYTTITPSEVQQGAILDQGLLLKIKNNSDAQQVELANKQALIDAQEQALTNQQQELSNMAAQSMPASTQKGTGTYTCPAGKYALVRINVSGSAISTAAGVNELAYTNGDFNETIEVWVKSGDTIAAALSNASASYTVAFNGNPTSNNRSGTTSVTINHNGAAIAIFRCVASVSGTVNPTGTISVTGASSFHWYAQEYINPA